MIVWTKPDELGNSLNGIRIIWQLKTEESPETSFSLLLHSTCQNIQTIHQRNVDLLWFSFFLILPWRIPPSDFCQTLPTSSQPRNESCGVDCVFLDPSLDCSTSTILFLSHNLEQIRQDLTHHQLEQESIFDVLSHSTPFQDIITPIVLNFRLRQRQVLPVNPPPIFQTSSNSPISEHVETQQSVIIQEWSNSNDSLLLFYTPAHDELGTRNNPIDVDWLLDPSPSPPRDPVYIPPQARSAPITTPCPMCHQHSHTSTQCVWYGPGVCSYCDEVGPHRT